MKKMTKKEARKNCSRIKKLMHLKGQIVIPIDILTKSSVGQRQTKIMQTAFAAGYSQEVVDQILVEAGACKSMAHAHARTTRHLLHDTDRKIAKREFVPLAAAM